jgi:hypothetical protein
MIFLPNPLHDSGCRTQSHEFLRPFTLSYTYCMVMFDYEGSGGEGQPKAELAQSVSLLLTKNGWPNRNAVIVIEPELENWVWVKSPNLAKIINWGEAELPVWLAQEQYKSLEEIKPKRPKEAFEAALRKAKKPRSSSIYQEIAQSVSFKNCTDEAFIQFTQQIEAWFGG